MAPCSTSLSQRGCINNQTLGRYLNYPRFTLYKVHSYNDTFNDLSGFYFVQMLESIRLGSLDLQQRGIVK
jgi:hypothetical protein